ncbi:S8 family serine peptidase [Plantactinospora sonchi]|uniref:S8 family serine peptidase n=1 Tax=Plantactinospora sonchi TaxID=1544735 RepID=A0ABU7RQU8_9ACTN
MKAKVVCGSDHHGRWLTRSLALLLLGMATPLVTSDPAAAASCYSRPVPAARATGAHWALRWLDPDRLRQVSTGSGVRVAVLDSGVDASHPQLAKAVDRGWDVVLDEADGRTDCVGHGTAVASLIAARPDGDAALVGVAPAARIVPIRVSEDGSGATSYRDVTPARLAAGIRRAVALDADVIQVSFAVGSNTAALRDAVADAAKRQIVVVAAVGDKTAGATYPAAYPGVVGVGAAESSGHRWTDSGSGPHVDLVAPGVELVAAARIRGHVAVGGTAAAAAMVSGAAALLKARHPKWTATQITNRLLATADGTPGGSRNDGYGYGGVNPYRALTESAETPGRTPEPHPVPAAALNPTRRPGLSTTTRRALGAGASGAGARVVGGGYAGAAAFGRRRRARA